MPGQASPMQPDWASSGQNNHNTRSAAAEHTINADNVGNLKTAWIFTTAGDVSATATVVSGCRLLSGLGWQALGHRHQDRQDLSGRTMSATTPEPLARPRGRARHTGMASWLSAPAT